MVNVIPTQHYYFLNNVFIFGLAKRYYSIYRPYQIDTHIKLMLLIGVTYWERGGVVFGVSRELWWSELRNMASSTQLVA